MIPKILPRLFALLLVEVACGLAQVTVPDTPAGHTLQAWPDAFNSGDRARIETYVKTVDQSQSVDGMISFRNQSAGFELLSIESSEPLHIRFRVKEKGGPTTALGNLLVKDGQPTTVGTFGLRALPPGAVLENVTIDAAERKKVTDGVDIDLKEYYVEPAAAQQMADALKTHETKGDYDAIADGDAFAAQLTKDLQDVSHDRHLPWTSAPSKCRRGPSLPQKTRRDFTNRWNSAIARSTRLRSCRITSGT
jgi:hypothetical protein